MTVGALAVLLLGSALLQDAASAALAASVDPSSRGIYDILVTADAASEAPTLLAPNSLYTGEEQLSLADVEAIRALAGVDLAAPIAQIVVPGQRGYQTQVRIPVDLGQPVSAPESYRAVLRLLGDSGLGERLITENTAALTLDRANVPPELPAVVDDVNSSCSIGAVAIPCSLFPWASAPRWRTAVWMEALDGTYSSTGESDGQTITLHMPASFSGDLRMTLIDPNAERALLGTAGGFLDPLIDLGGPAPVDYDALESWAEAHDTPAARAINATARATQKFQDEFLAGAAYLEYARIMRERGEEPDPNAYTGTMMPVVPMLLADDLAAGALRAELSVESFGPSGPLPDPLENSGGYVPNPPIPDAVRNGDPGVALPPVSIDASVLLNPASYGALSLPWPGTVPRPAPESAFPDYPFYVDLSSPVSVHDLAPGVATVGSEGAQEVRLDGVGFHKLGGDAGSVLNESLRGGADVNPDLAGTESVFGVVRARERGVPTQGEYRAGISVGGFSTGGQRAITELAAGIPLGAYEPSDATLLATADDEGLSVGSPVAGFGPLGLAAGRTSAIADINSVAFRSENKVDAVRVRVAGVERYDAAGISAVTQAARKIERLGYRATIVAGSQGEDLKVSVGGYAFGTMDAATPQRVGELGVIQQRWSVLGPAAAAGAGLGAGTQLLLGTALLAVLGAFAVIEAGAVSARRREAAVLRGLGWRSRRIVAWFAAEHAVALPVLAAAGLAAVLVAADPGLTATVVAAALLAGTAIALTALARATRAPRAWTASEAELQHARGDARAREFERRPEARVLGADPSAAESLPAARIVRMPRSPLLWGLQRAWRSPAASLPRAAAVGAVMAPSPRSPRPSAEPGGVGPAQLLLAGAGVAAGLVLLAVVRQRDREVATLEPGDAPAAVLAASGWLPREVRLAALAESLAAPLAAALLGSYALWFVLSSAGIDSVNTPVSAALVAGLAAALLLLPPRPRPSSSPSAEKIPARKAALSRGIAS
ncbi:hypothetical protein [Microterricola pindariensis]|uniref:hypothetical protein n=1 Tax=Microterricola pindariensis TaxID=478010 RepID=UPI000CECB477|nr:hypothetical protein [Microterricola pindariensis]